MILSFVWIILMLIHLLYIHVVFNISYFLAVTDSFISFFLLIPIIHAAWFPLKYVGFNQRYKGLAVLIQAGVAVIFVALWY